MSALSLDEEARLYSTNAERERYESLATLFGIIVALDYLERAYVRDSVTAAECVALLAVAVACVLSCRFKRYSPACTKLLSQYKTMLKLVGDSFGTIEEFMSRYRVRPHIVCSSIFQRHTIDTTDGPPGCAASSESRRSCNRRAFK